LTIVLLKETGIGFEVTTSCYTPDKLLEVAIWA